MVHALAECWRVLQIGGRLIDLRPHVSGWSAEVVNRESRLLVAQLDDKRGISDDIASYRAILETVHKGWFEKEIEEFFEYAYY